ncbi:MAG: DNA-binding protein [Nitrososphaerales archaeon]
MTDDPEVEIIKAKKLREMKKKMMMEEKKKAMEEEKGRRPKTDREVLFDHLVERGDEVLSAAERQYPKEMAMIVTKFAQLIRNGEVLGMISGGDLLALLRAIGLRVRMDTRIRVEEHGKLISLSERLKSDEV